MTSVYPCFLCVPCSGRKKKERTVAQGHISFFGFSDELLLNIKDDYFFGVDEK